MIHAGKPSREIFLTKMKYVRAYLFDLFHSIDMGTVPARIFVRFCYVCTQVHVMRVLFANSSYVMTFCLFLLRT